MRTTSSLTLLACLAYGGTVLGLPVDSTSTNLVEREDINDLDSREVYDFGARDIMEAREEHNNLESRRFKFRPPSLPNVVDFGKDVIEDVTGNQGRSLEGRRNRKHRKHGKNRGGNKKHNQGSNSTPITPMTPDSGDIGVVTPPLETPSPVQPVYRRSLEARHKRHRHGRNGSKHRKHKHHKDHKSGNMGNNSAPPTPSTPEPPAMPAPATPGADPNSAPPDASGAATTQPEGRSLESRWPTRRDHERRGGDHHHHHHKHHHEGHGDDHKHEQQPPVTPAIGTPDVTPGNENGPAAPAPSSESGGSGGATPPSVPQVTPGGRPRPKGPRPLIKTKTARSLESRKRHGRGRKHHKGGMNDVPDVGESNDNEARSLFARRKGRSGGKKNKNNKNKNNNNNNNNNNNLWPNPLDFIPLLTPQTQPPPPPPAPQPEQQQ